MSKIRVRCLSLFLAMILAFNLITVSFASVPVTATVYDGEYNINTAAVTLTVPGSYLIEGTGEATSNVIKITVAGNYQITLKDVNIELTSGSSLSPVSIADGVTLTLTLEDGTTNTLVPQTYGAGIQVSPNASLIIDGFGTLVITPNNVSVGIGGIVSATTAANCGNVTILNGNISILGGKAGIGGAAGKNANRSEMATPGGNCGNISILGGFVSISVQYGTAIGGGAGGSGAQLNSSDPERNIHGKNGGTVGDVVIKNSHVTISSESVGIGAGAGGMAGALYGNSVIYGVYGTDGTCSKIDVTNSTLTMAAKTAIQQGKVSNVLTGSFIVDSLSSVCIFGKILNEESIFDATSAIKGNGPPPIIAKPESHKDIVFSLDYRDASSWLSTPYNDFYITIPAGTYKLYSNYTFKNYEKEVIKKSPVYSDIFGDTVTVADSGITNVGKLRAYTYTTTSDDTANGVSTPPPDDCFWGWRQSPGNWNEQYLESATPGKLGAGIELLAVLAPDKAPYKIEHYIENIDDYQYTKVPTDIILTSHLGTTIDISSATAPKGLVKNSSHPDNVLTGVLTENPQLVLRQYFDRMTYRIAYTTNCPDTDGETLRAVKFGTSLSSLLPVLTYTGYSFDGWYFDTAFSEKTSVDFVVDGSYNVYAKWVPNSNTTYTVNHYVQNINDNKYTLAVAENLTGTTGTSVTAKIKDIVGCFPKTENASLSGIIAPDGTLKFDIYYDRYTYLVSFDSNGGTSVSSQAPLKYGATATEPRAPEKAGFVLDGWYLADAATRFTFDTPITGDTKLFANWIPATDTPYTVTHHVQNIDNDEYTAIDTERLSGVTGESVVATAKDMYGFTLATDESMLAGVVFADGSLNIDVFYDRILCEVLFESDAVMDIDPASIRYGATIAAPSNPTKQGYSFVGWYDESYSEQFLFSNPITESLTLYAKWNPCQDTPYTVNHYKQGISGSNYALSTTETLSGTTGESITVLPQSYVGFTPTTGEKDLCGIIVADGSLSFDIYYDRNSYPVSFQTGQDEITVPPQTVMFQGLVSKPIDPQKSGFTFVGWYCDEALSVPYEFATPVSEPLALFAKWEKHIIVDVPSAPSGTAPDRTSCEISVTVGAGGEVSPRSLFVKKGSEQTFAFTANRGYEIDAILVDGKAIPVAASYSFVNVTKSHTIAVSFKKTATDHACTVKDFADIDLGLWYHAGIDYVLSNGLMTGRGNEMFAPGEYMTRAEFATVMARIAKIDLTNYTDKSFDDVDVVAWYASAIAWAKSAGVVSGYNDTNFAPDNNITREQFVLMLYRYYKDNNSNTAESNNFADYSLTSTWARDAIDWAIINGLLTGVEPTILAPQANISRAECAQILMRLLSK